MILLLLQITPGGKIALCILAPFGGAVLWLALLILRDVCRHEAERRRAQRQHQAEGLSAEKPHPRP